MAHRQLYKRSTKKRLLAWRRIHTRKSWVNAGKVFKKGKNWCCYFYFN